MDHKHTCSLFGLCHPHLFVLLKWGNSFLNYYRLQRWVSRIWLITSLTVTHFSFIVYDSHTFSYEGKFTVTVPWPAWHTDPILSLTHTHTESGPQSQSVIRFLCFPSSGLFFSDEYIWNQTPPCTPPTLTHVILTGKQWEVRDDEEVIPLSV